MGETRVDLEHLLEDLRDAYPSSLEETILTEIIANSLDSGAGRIVMTADPAQGTLTAVDNGSGMQRTEMRRYHDIAASTKVRGQGIGFAGVGIKLGLLVCEDVITETKRGKTHVATRWHLASRHRAPWSWLPPPGLTGERGTAVRLKLHTPLSPLLDPGFVEGVLRRHYQPLLEPTFDELLAAQYPDRIIFKVNGRPLEQHRAGDQDQAPLVIRLARRRKPSALGYLARHAAPLPEDQRGVAISTLGKVIKRGWDWLGVTPLQSERINGVIEVPDLAASLTLNKGDFIRTGTRGAVYLAYRKAIQEAVSRQLEAWGDTRSGVPDASSRMMRPLERDLDRVLEELSDDFPAPRFTRRAPGRRAKAIADQWRANGHRGQSHCGPGSPGDGRRLQSSRHGTRAATGRLRRLNRMHHLPSLRCPRLPHRGLPCFLGKNVPARRCGMGLVFSLRNDLTIRSWGDWSNPPSGSIRPIPPIGVRWPPVPWAITFHSLSRLPWLPSP